MKKKLILLAALAYMMLLGGFKMEAQELKFPKDGTAKTVAFLTALQNSDGGFSAKPGESSTLAATSTAIRALKYIDAKPKNTPAAIGYIKSCRDAKSGGFALTPGGRVDLSSTAMGIVALGALNLLDDEWMPRAIDYLVKQANKVENIRLALGCLGMIDKTLPQFPEWHQKLLATRNVDGTWGQGKNIVTETGELADRILTMNFDLEKRYIVITVLKQSQNQDGGWAFSDKPSSLYATYVVMRAFQRLKVSPDLKRLREFIKARRKPDNTYSGSPKESGDLQSTYFALYIDLVIRELETSSN